jgi:hypothetical protein
VVERKVSPYLPLADSETHEVVPHQSQWLAGSVQGKLSLPFVLRQGLSM